MPHQDRGSRYHFGEESVFFINSSHFYQVYLICFEGTMVDKRYCSIFVTLATSEPCHLHLRSVWWMILDISPTRQILKEGVFPTYILHFNIFTRIFYISTVYVVLDKRPFCSDITWRTSYFRLFCIGLCPKEIVKLCNCVDSKLSESLKNILYQEDSYKFRMSIHNFGFRIGFLSSSAMERREDGAQRMLGSLPWIDSQFVGLCAEL